MAVLTLNVTGSQTPTITDSTDRSAFASESAESSCFSVDCDYAGGNIIVDRLEGDHVYVHQDLRDTIGNWFYWNFRVKGAAGRSLTIHFTDTNVIGVRGPAVSNDGGKTWRWLGAGAVRDQSFTYTCAVDEKEVRFCFAMPYVQENLDAFLFAYRDHPHLHVTPLCKSKKGRDVSRLHKRWHSTQIKPGEGDSGRRARSENGWNEWMENHTLLFQDLRDWIAFDSADCSLTFSRPIFIT